MKKLLILSGKGGTGKTTTAAAFIRFSNAETMADCDVDAPNLYLVAGAEGEPQKTVYEGSKKAFINPALCISCGKCMKNCRFGAVENIAGIYAVNPVACEGCGVCQYVCPQNAVSMENDASGELYLYKENKVFSSAELKMGRGNSGKLVSAVKSAMEKAAKPDSTAIIDGSPGIGCPVISSISGVDMVLIVAEPTASGLSDLKRIVKTAGSFDTKIAVSVNKYDTSIAKTAEIESFCRENGILFAGKVPYDKTASEAMCRGESIADTDCPARDALFEVYKVTMKELLKD